jgi:Cyclin C-terminal domain
MRLFSVKPVLRPEVNGHGGSEGGEGGQEEASAGAVSAVFNDTSKFLDPLEAVWVCLYIACKADEFYVSATDLAARVSAFLARDEECVAAAQAGATRLAASTEDVANWCVELELVVLQVLEFHLSVYHPFRPLFGLFVLIRKNHPDLAPERLGELSRHAREHIALLYTTDFPLVVAPPLLAWALLQISAEDLGMADEFAGILAESGEEDKIAVATAHRILVDKLAALKAAPPIEPLSQVLALS